MNLVKVKISELKPHPQNYNTHPEAQIKELVKSLQMFGQFKNIVIRQGLLICGHGLVEAAKKIGWTELYAEIRDDLSDDEAKAMMVADNALPFGGAPESNVLDDLLKSIPFGDIPGVTEDWLNDMGQMNLIGFNGNDRAGASPWERIGQKAGDCTQFVFGEVSCNVPIDKYQRFFDFVKDKDVLPVIIDFIDSL